MNHPDIFMVLDVESNGLYGQPFCIGAVMMNWGGRVMTKTQFMRCEIDEVEDEWVLEHVIPRIKHINVTYDNLDELCTHFIEWYQFWSGDRKVPIYVDAGFPVDYAFLYHVGKVANRDGINWESPYPVYDISSILAAKGVDPDINREEYASPMIGLASGRKRDPVWDAELSGLCLIRALNDE